MCLILLFFFLIMFSYLLTKYFSLTTVLWIEIIAKRKQYALVLCLHFTNLGLVQFYWGQICRVRASGLIVMCINLHRWWRWYLRPGKVSLQTGEERKVGKKVSSGSAQESKEGRENQIWGEKPGCCDSHYTNNILNSWLITILITNMTTAGILYLPLF